MASFSEEDIRQIREANDLVELFSERTRVQRRGRDFWCCCPFHQEKTPSCKIDPSTQTWHCFGCGEGGDAITYIEKLDDVGFVDALRFLARRAGIELKETETDRKNQDQTSPTARYLPRDRVVLSHAAHARSFTQKRRQHAIIFRGVIWVGTCRKRGTWGLRREGGGW